MSSNIDDKATALLSGDREVSYQSFWASVAGLGDWLKDSEGVAPGDRVPLVQSNAEALMYQVLACIQIGAVACPLNTRWPKQQIAAVAEGLSPRGLDVQPSAWLARLSDSQAIWNTSDAQQAIIVHTSGSSGNPKAAVLSFGNLSLSAARSNQNIPLEAGDRWLLSLPLYHVGGLGIAFRCLSAGATMVLPEADEAPAESITRYRPTHVSLVATQLYRLLQDAEAAQVLAGMKAVLLGGSAVPESLVREVLDRGIPIFTSYGMTETASQICCTEPGDSAEHLLTSGRPLAEGTVSISEDGEILVRGEALFQGYLQPDGSLDLPLTDEGWFRTGDLGLLEADGYLHVTGRRDNMFISGGENIQPEEIEAALCGLPSVIEAVVVPVDDAEWGQRPVAFVRMADDTEPDDAALNTTLRETLAGYKIPKSFFPWPDDLAQTGIKTGRTEFAQRAKSLTKE